MRRLVSLAAVSALGMSVLIGCGHRQAVVMAPPVSQNPGYNAPVNTMGGAPVQGGMNAAAGSVFQWQDVPPGQQVPIMRATFDQGGYQLFAQSGETIVVPFVNNNMYVMKFGRTTGQNYFINENGVPTLYLQPGQGLENAAAQGAMWYPIPQNYNYSQPMYVALAPTWNDYTNMGWYPGMTYYGGMWGYTPYSHFSWMPGFYINIGGRRYTDYGGYSSYYRSTPGYIRNRVVYTNYNTPRSVAGRTFGSTGSYRSGSTGSFNSGRRTFGSTGAAGSTGSFGTGSTRRTFGGSTGSTGFGAAGSTGSFGSGSTRRTFGGSTGSTGFGSSGSSSGSFGTGSTRRTFGGSTGSTGFGTSGTRTTPSTGSGSFGGSRSSGSSFGGSSGSTSTPRSTGSSFGGSRSSGSSFGGGSTRSSGSFGGSRRR